MSMLGYVFWHWAGAAVSAEEYESRLLAFHRSLQEAPPDGFLGSACFRFSGVSWVPPAGAYEDWYEVADFTALGVLNDAAVAGARKRPHDTVAQFTESGSGGLYRLITGQPRLRETRFAIWFRKPRGMTYEALYAEFDPYLAETSGALWRRQLALGPGPEFCLRTATRFRVPEKFEPTEVTLDLLGS